MENRLKIAMFGIKGIPLPAGAEVVAEEVGSRLAQRGHEVVIYVRPHYTSRDSQEYRGMRLIHLPSIPSKNLDAITHSLLCCIAVVRERPDIVHIHSTGNSIFALWLRVAGIPVLVQSHGLDWQRTKWGKLARIYLKMTDYTTVHFPDAVTAVSMKLKRYYESKYRREVVYIPNGVSPCKRMEASQIRAFGLHGNDYIFFGARFVPEKGAHYLIEAYKSLNLCTKKLVIAGDGDPKDPYVVSLKKYASDRIIFPGFVRGTLLQEFLSNAYLYVLPSEIEGLSTGLLEAMGYGNCVLVSDIEENREAVGSSGFYFKNKSIQDLQDKIQYLLDNPDIINHYKDLALQRVTKLYNWDQITDQFENLYRTIVKTNKKN